MGRLIDFERGNRNSELLQRTANRLRTRPRELRLGSLSNRVSSESKAIQYRQGKAGGMTLAVDNSIFGSTSQRRIFRDLRELRRRPGAGSPKRGNAARVFFRFPEKTRFRFPRDRTDPGGVAQTGDSREAGQGCARSPAGGFMQRQRCRAGRRMVILKKRGGGEGTACPGWTLRLPAR